MILPATWREAYLLRGSSLLGGSGLLRGSLLGYGLGFLQKKEWEGLVSNIVHSSKLTGAAIQILAADGCNAAVLGPEKS
jgi:hypothetical protein